jgi:outer membrane lipoprotein LolB
MRGDTVFHQPELWASHQSQMLGIEQWHIKGKFGYKSPSGGGSAWLDWRRQNDAFTLLLNGPFGVGTVQIHGGNDLVTMHHASDPIVYASSLEALSDKLFDWNLPIGELRYWVLGIPSPKFLSKNHVFNREGLLKTFQQTGWQIKLSQYQNRGAGKLPGKLIIHQGQLRFTLVIKEHDFSAAPTTGNLAMRIHKVRPTDVK